MKDCPNKKSNSSVGLGGTTYGKTSSWFLQIVVSKIVDIFMLP